MNYSLLSFALLCDKNSVNTALSIVKSNHRVNVKLDD